MMIYFDNAATTPLSENVKNDIIKTKRNITPEKFNNVCNAIHIPYIMEKPKLIMLFLIQNLLINQK